MRLYTHWRKTPRWIPNWRTGGDPPLPGFTITWLWWSWCFNTPSVNDEAVRLLKAPWTDEQIAALDRRQERDDLHPYTCPDCSHSLEAFPDGWHCENQCGYTQDWCFARDATTPPQEGQN